MIDELRAALEALPDPAWCEGAVAHAGVTIDGAPIDTARLLARSEQAPFGDDTGTRLDRAVRDTRRVTSRGATAIAGIDLAAIVREVEDQLATDCAITAELLDVLIYPPGSRFVPHRDTPRTDDQLGTLIVGLPIAHEGGALRLVDGDVEHVVDWSGAPPPATLRWVALFGDVSHEIERVESGARITVVYTLRYRSESRLRGPRTALVDAIADAAIERVALAEHVGESTLVIPCGRMIVAPRDREVALGVGALRGADRVIAAALARATIEVTVRECIVASYDDPSDDLATTLEEAAQHRQFVFVRNTLDPHILDDAHAVSWARDPGGDEDDYPIVALADHLMADSLPSNREWMIPRSRRLFGREVLYSQTGYFGNEYSTSSVYRFAIMLARITG